MSKLAVISGFGTGLGSELATQLLASGYQVVGLSRSGDDAGMAEHPDFSALACDITQPDKVSSSFARIRAEFGDANVLVHNAGHLLISDFADVSAEQFRAVWETNCLGAMLCAQAVIPGMLEQERGTLIFSGATASVKGSANFSAFASSKFALRGLAQSLARQYGPNGIHVVHTLLDGVIWGNRAKNDFNMAQNSCMQPADIASAYVQLIEQPHSAWTHELDMRPFMETF